MNAIRFSCTSLMGTNKVGNLPRDDKGYYTVVVGALNMFNSAGQYYVYEQAKSLFEGSSQMMRRIKRGALRGEYGHPKMMPGMAEREFAGRVLSIWEERVSHHFSEMWLDFDSMRDDQNRPVIAIMAKVSPSGPYGHVLERSLQNTRENVCFSIRAFTDDCFSNGRVERTLKNVITFDYVNEPGMSVAEKFKSPALEGLDDVMISRGNIERGVAGLKQQNAMAQESALLSAEELFRNMGWHAPQEVTQKLSESPWSKW